MPASETVSVATARKRYFHRSIYAVPSRPNIYCKRNSYLRRYRTRIPELSGTLHEAVHRSNGTYFVSGPGATERHEPIASFFMHTCLLRYSMWTLKLALEEFSLNLSPEIPVHCETSCFAAFAPARSWRHGSISDVFLMTIGSK